MTRLPASDCASSVCRDGAIYLLRENIDEGEKDRCTDRCVAKHITVQSFVWYNFTVVDSVKCICVLLSACGKNEREQTIIGITGVLKEYESLPYGEFKKQTGREAELYHTTLFCAEIPDSSIDIIYNGEYDRNLLISLDESTEETIIPESVAWLEMRN